MEYHFVIPELGALHGASCCGRAPQTCLGRAARRGPVLVGRVQYDTSHAGDSHHRTGVRITCTAACKRVSTGASVRHAVAAMCSADSAALALWMEHGGERLNTETLFVVKERPGRLGLGSCARRRRSFCTKRNPLEVG